MSIVIVSLSGGPSKYTKMSTNKVIEVNPSLIVKESIEEVSILGKNLAKVVKELV